MRANRLISALLMLQAHGRLTARELAMRLEVSERTATLSNWHRPDGGQTELGALPFEDDEEAIRIANSLPYGLAAGVWTENIGRALTMAKRLEAGTVWVNTYRAVSYMAPFGGYKRSGLGRENGMDMIKEYLQTKSVWIDISGNTPNPFVHR